jgi:hypothetical protein
MAGLLLLAPVVLALVVGVVLVTVLAATATRDARLLGTVAAARRHGTATGAVAVVLAVGAAAVQWGAGWASALGSGVAELAVPLTFALVHTAVIAVGEVTWPRPRGAVRSASLAVRGPSSVAPRGLHRLFRATALLVGVVCTAGWLTADGSGRAISSTFRNAAGHQVGGGTSGPYPGAVFALPAAVGTVAVVLAVELGLRLVASRAAVAGADTGSEEALRRASAHRLLRGACTGLLATAGGLLLTGGAALRSLYQGSLGGVVGQEVLLGHDGRLVAVGLVAAALGLACGLAALVVLCLPAPRVGEPGPAVASAVVPG